VTEMAWTRYVLALLLCWSPGDASAADSLSYPAPPNPFAQKPPEPPSLEPERPPAGRLRRRLQPRWQPVVCLGLLSLAGAATKPHEPSLLAAIDAYHGMHAGGNMASPVSLRDCGIACIAHHGELVWLGWLGRWLPFLPTSVPAARELLSAAGADQLLLWALLGGYLLRKLLPARLGDAHLSKSFRNVLRQGRLWVLLTASFCPSGLVHWVHASAMLLLTVQGLEDQFGRLQLVGLYAAAGLCAASLSLLAQLAFRRTAEPRPSVSGAVMGLLVLRLALDPAAAVVVGRWQLPVARLLLLHLLLDAGSNAAANGLGLSKLVDLLGGALMVAGVIRPQLEGSGSCWRQLADLRQLLAYAKSSLSLGGDN